MKKVIALITSAAAYTVLAGKAIAQDAPLPINIKTPERGITTNAANIGQVIGNALMIVYSIGALLVLFFIILGAFNWITSGGDKDKVKNARGYIVNALVGLALLALAALITNVLSRILGFGDVLNFQIPTLNSNLPAAKFGTAP